MSSSPSDNPRPATATQQDIARKLGVSGAAVSMALNGTGTLAKSTRAKILQAAEEMGYQPDPILSALARRRGTGKTDTFRAPLALLHGAQQGHPLQKYLPPAKTTAESLGYGLQEILIQTPADYPRVLRELYYQGCQGLLLMDCPWDDACAALPWDRFSLVVLRESHWAPPFNRVRSGIFQKWLTLAEIARDRGYRCPVQLVYVQDLSLTHWEDRSRVAAAQLVRHLCGETICPPPLIITWRAEFAVKRERLQACLSESPQRCDYLISTDSSGKLLLEQLGIVVPGEMGVVSNIGDDSTDCSGMQNNAAEVARRAVQFMDSEIRHNHRGLPESPVDLVVPSVFQDVGTLPEQTRGRLTSSSGHPRN